MANSIVQPYKGPFIIDVQELDGSLVDVVAGATRGLRREKEGIAAVLVELSKSVPEHATTLGVAPDLSDRINNTTSKLEKVRAAIVAVTKLAEILDETEIYLEDEREGDIGTIVKAARDASRRRDPSIVANFEQTIHYHGQNAIRGQATRRKNAEQPDAPEPNEGQAAPAPPPPAPTP